jgi:hypothetical protein
MLLCKKHWCETTHDVRVLMSVRIIDRHELHTGIHQGRYELPSSGTGGSSLAITSLAFAFSGRERLPIEHGDTPMSFIQKPKAWHQQHGSILVPFCGTRLSV